MKKQVKKLTLVKERISKLDAMRVSGGAAPNNGGIPVAPPAKEPITFLYEGCGTSVHRPACEGDSIRYCDS
jgi:hypothetical protein